MHTSTRFALVGPGRAGTALTEALTRSGWTLTTLAGRAADAPSTLRATERFGVPAAPIDHVGRSADVVLLATPDAAIADVASDMAAGLERDALVVHLAGSTGLEPFAALARVRSDVRLGACHPLMTLAGTAADVDRLAQTWFAVEGDEGAVAVAEAVGGRTFRVDDRAAYHAAACVASNHLVALMGQVERLAESAGVPAEAFLPLVEVTLANVRVRGPAAALTGPVARGDAETVASHLAVLPEGEHPAYRALALEALRLADLRYDDRRALTAVLEGVAAA